MENARVVFNFIFHWSGVWAVMVYGTVGARAAYLALRDWAHAREKKRLFERAIRNLKAPEEADEHQAQEAAQKSAVSG